MVFRRRIRKRKFFRKRGFQKFKRFRRGVKRVIKKMAEKKYINSNGVITNNAVISTFQNDPINVFSGTITQGVGSNQRVGNRIQTATAVIRVSVRMKQPLIGSPTDWMKVRGTLFSPRQSTDPVSTDTVGYLGTGNPQKQRTIRDDWKIIGDTAAEQAKSPEALFSYFLRYKRNINYGTDAAGALNDLTNRIWFSYCTLHDPCTAATAQTLEISFQTRVSFIDI